MKTFRFAINWASAALVVAALSVSLIPAGADAQLPPPSHCLGGSPCKLSVNLPEGDVLGVWPAPNSTRVVFVHRGTDFVNTLYSVPVGGGSPRKLNVAGSAAFRAISPDGTRVLYTAVAGLGQPSTLFSVPIAGPASAAVRLASNVTVNVAKVRVQVSPDSRKVVYRPAEGDQLRAVPIEGPASASVRLTDPFVAGGAVREFAISANSGSAVYLANQEAIELYRVPLTLSPSPDPRTVKLNAPLVQGGNVLDFRLAANNGPVVYRADQDADDVFELYSVQLGGSGRVKINRSLPFRWDVAGTATNNGQQQGYTVVPNGTRVVYEIDNNSDNIPLVYRYLYSVPIAGPGSASVRLDAASGTSVEVSYQVSADSAWVVYSVQGTGGRTASRPWGPRAPACWSPGRR